MSKHGYRFGNRSGRWLGVVAASGAAAFVAVGPTQADTYRTNKDGVWTDLTMWENETAAEDPATTLPELGDVVDGRSGHSITVPTGYDASASDLIMRSSLTVESGATLESNDFDLSTNGSMNLFGVGTFHKASSLRDRVSGYEIEVFAGATFNMEDDDLTTRGGDVAIYGSGTTFKLRTYEWVAVDNGGSGGVSELAFIADASGLSTLQIAAFNSNGGVLDFNSDVGPRSLTVDVTALSPVGGESWTLLSYDEIQRDSLGIDWHTKSIVGAADPGNWTINVGDTATTLSYVPEPASVALLGAGLLCLPRRRGRRSDQA